MEKGYVVINLLPYRERMRKEKVKTFSLLMGIFATSALFVVFLANAYLSSHIEEQASRNTYIEKKNKELDTQIKEIASLKDDIRETLAKRQVVETLQIDRSDAVSILNTIAAELPEGVLLKSVKQAGNKVEIVGTTLINSKIAHYMSNLEKSSSFQSPQIMEVKLLSSTASKGKFTKSSSDTQESEFLITLELEPKIEAAQSALGKEGVLDKKSANKVK